METYETTCRHCKEVITQFGLKYRCDVSDLTRETEDLLVKRMIDELVSSSESLVVKSCQVWVVHDMDWLTSTFLGSLMKRMHSDKALHNSSITRKELKDRTHELHEKFNHDSEAVINLLHGVGLCFISGGNDNRIAFPSFFFEKAGPAQLRNFDIAARNVTTQNDHIPVVEVESVVLDDLRKTKFIFLFCGADFRTVIGTHLPIALRNSNITLKEGTEIAIVWTDYDNLLVWAADMEFEKALESEMKRAEECEALIEEKNRIIKEKDAEIEECKRILSLRQSKNYQLTKLRKRKREA